MQKKKKSPCLLTVEHSSVTSKWSHGPSGKFMVWHRRNGSFYRMFHAQPSVTNAEEKLSLPLSSITPVLSMSVLSMSTSRLSLKPPGVIEFCLKMTDTPSLPFAKKNLHFYRSILTAVCLQLQTVQFYCTK